MTEINNVTVGGIELEFAYFIKSLVLDNLLPNQAVKLEIINYEGLYKAIPAGIIRIEENFDIVYYTAQGLKEIWPINGNPQELKRAKELKSKSEEFLFENKYISKINLDKIYKVD